MMNLPKVVLSIIISISITACSGFNLNKEAGAQLAGQDTEESGDVTFGINTAPLTSGAATIKFRNLQELYRMYAHMFGVPYNSSIYASYFRQNSRFLMQRNIGVQDAVINPTGLITPRTKLTEFFCQRFATNNMASHSTISSGIRNQIHVGYPLNGALSTSITTTQVTTMMTNYIQFISQRNAFADELDGAITTLELLKSMPGMTGIELSAHACVLAAAEKWIFGRRTNVVDPGESS